MRLTLFLTLLFIHLGSVTALAETRKDKLVDKLSEQGLSQREAEAEVERVFATIRSELKAGRTVDIRRFGRFTVRERAQRKPKANSKSRATNEKSFRPKRKYVHFQSAETLKLDLNPEAE